eukprot:Gb_34159 [translate_table: standard]
MGQQSLIYSFVARGTVVLAEYTQFTGNFTTIANQCLQKIPASNNKFTYNCDRHTFNYLVEDGFSDLVVISPTLPDLGALCLVEDGCVFLALPLLAHPNSLKQTPILPELLSSIGAKGRFIPKTNQLSVNLEFPRVNDNYTYKPVTAGRKSTIDTHMKQQQRGYGSSLAHVQYPVISSCKISFMMSILKAAGKCREESLSAFLTGCVLRKCLNIWICVSLLQQICVSRVVSTWNSTADFRTSAEHIVLLQLNQLEDNYQWPFWSASWMILRRDMEVEELTQLLPTALTKNLGKDLTCEQVSWDRSKLKEHMQYCIDHPEEISKIAKVKAQVSEVKGVMMENIEKGGHNLTPNSALPFSFQFSHPLVMLLPQHYKAMLLLFSAIEDMLSSSSTLGSS